MINQKSIELIKEFEGEKLTSYKDTGGIWTIGVGHTSDEFFAVKPNQTISKEKSTELLLHDLKEAESFVDRFVKVPINENQRGALVSFTFNLGGGAFKGSTLLRKLNTGDYKSVPFELSKWVNDDGVRLKGLVRRRAAEGVLWNTPMTAEVAVKPTEKPVQSVPVEQTTVVLENTKRSPMGFLVAVVLIIIAGIANCGGFI